MTPQKSTAKSTTKISYYPCKIHAGSEKGVAMGALRPGVPSTGARNLKSAQSGQERLQKVFLYMWTRSLLHWCKTGLHWCNRLISRSLHAQRQQNSSTIKIAHSKFYCHGVSNEKQPLFNSVLGQLSSPPPCLAAHRKIAVTTVAAGALATIPLQKSQGFFCFASQKKSLAAAIFGVSLNFTGSSQRPRPQVAAAARFRGRNDHGTLSTNAQAPQKRKFYFRYRP